MQHPLTPEQVAAAQARGEIVELGNKGLLNVPDEPELGRDWFVQRAAEVLAEVGGVAAGDVVHAMGQQQLAMAISAASRRAGATLIESVTRRESVEETLPDKSVKKTNVFRFTGFREVHEY